jgi:hypothetical protein
MVTRHFQGSGGSANGRKVRFRGIIDVYRVNQDICVCFAGPEGGGQNINYLSEADARWLGANVLAYAMTKSGKEVKTDG